MADPAPAGGGPCPECGVDNGADHNYCKHCGTPLREVALERELGSGFAERTRDRCLQLLKADPDNASAHYNLGLAYYHLGQIGNAIRAFIRARTPSTCRPSATKRREFTRNVPQLCYKSIRCLKYSSALLLLTTPNFW